jgi:ubiquitin
MTTFYGYSEKKIEEKAAKRHMTFNEYLRYLKVHSKNRGKRTKEKS